MTELGLVLDPDLRYPAEIRDVGAGRRILGLQGKLGVVFQFGVIVATDLRQGGADELVGHELIDIEVAIGALQMPQRLDRRRNRLTVFRLPGHAAGLQAERPVKQISHFRIDACHLGDQLAVFLGFLRDQTVGFKCGAQIGDDNLGIFVGIFGVDQRPVKGRRVGL